MAVNSGEKFVLLGAPGGIELFLFLTADHKIEPILVHKITQRTSIIMVLIIVHEITTHSVYPIS